MRGVVVHRRASRRPARLLRLNTCRGAAAPNRAAFTPVDGTWRDPLGLIQTTDTPSNSAMKSATSPSSSRVTSGAAGGLILGQARRVDQRVGDCPLTHRQVKQHEPLLLSPSPASHAGGLQSAEVLLALHFLRDAGLAIPMPVASVCAMHSMPSPVALAATRLLRIRRACSFRDALSHHQHCMLQGRTGECGI